jgi:hypothetical protein
MVERPTWRGRTTRSRRSMEHRPPREKKLGIIEAHALTWNSRIIYPRNGGPHWDAPNPRPSRMPHPWQPAISVAECGWCAWFVMRGPTRTAIPWGFPIRSGTPACCGRWPSEHILQTIRWACDVSSKRMPGPCKRQGFCSNNTGFMSRWTLEKPLFSSMSRWLRKLEPPGWF